MAKDMLKYIRSMILKAEIHLKIAQMAKSFIDYKKEQLHNVKRKALIKKKKIKRRHKLPSCSPPAGKILNHNKNTLAFI